MLINTNWQCWIGSRAVSCFCLISAFSFLTMVTIFFSSSRMSVELRERGERGGGREGGREGEREREEGGRKREGEGGREGGRCGGGREIEGEGG